ncbi:Mur ligase family protein [Arthrobacter burdickii]|jgi:UDP-N-acetylmuramyl tripeptide synthase|uniref:Lipid II isoglutaminyl synthase (glutamine-hydrolyzing) subunit MurT n=1 Tax=Arthrobacter burdickii TaxID=3035920 RepID=A0ABT8K2W8_9MICC|nr:Mur ligase family protein [Arthrobacter burdickii]MDN4611783.1 MurT ligase domain-containing protein [Arthrobacter burdickii]
MNPLPVLVGKAVRIASRLRGGGSAFPGLVVERLDPGFMGRALSNLPYGVVVVSGTNGKTTTTKMVVELLEGQGLSVFTNRTGSNFTRGVAAALLGEVDWRGRLKADVAVLELDEAHAVHFVKLVPPRYSLLLNVLRDQLDRFGEIDATTRLLERIALATTGTVVLNREDPRVAGLASSIQAAGVVYFGLDASLRSTFPNDDELRGAAGTAPASALPADVVLRSVDGNSAEFEVEGTTTRTDLRLRGVYNIFNAAAALAAARAVLGGTADNGRLFSSLAAVEPAFGRGESLVVDGQALELVLVKNPSGFRLGLKSFDPAGCATMIAINDNYADGRDMSWLWDVDFDSLGLGGVDVVSGVRAYDMALRLKYDDVRVGAVEPDITDALQQFIRGSDGRPKRIFCTYTAMLAVRRELSKITKVEVVS